MTIIYFLIALGFLIIAHEFGHLIVAKLSGIRVEQFSIGFGPKLFGFRKGETDYRISLLPLGGYVKMLGEDPEDEEGAEDPRSFSKQGKRIRAAVIFAGPIMNVLLCIILMPLVFMIGKEEPKYLSERPVVEKIKKETPAEAAGFLPGDVILKIDNKDVKDWDDVMSRVIISPEQDMDFAVQRGAGVIHKKLTVATIPDVHGGYVGFEPGIFIGNKAIIGGVLPGGPSDRAGFKKGDEIVAIDGTPVDDWFSVLKSVSESNGREQEMKVRRGQETLQLKVTPEFSKDYKRWVIGIAKDTKQEDVAVVKMRYGLLRAIEKGEKEVYKLTRLTFEVLKRLFTFRLSYKALGGPIQIAHATAVAAKSGLADFVYFLAFLSLQLGILNLLPIPVLDGGHLVFIGAEAVRRRPLSTRVRIVAQQVGLVFIICVLALVTFNDIDRLWGIKSWLKGLF